MKNANLPEIFISVNRNRQKIYTPNTDKGDDTKEIYLNNGCNFEIEIYNNQQEQLGFQILLNGKSISESLVIVKPAQRVYVERYINTNNKFIFETYDVDITPNVDNIIKNNGKITVNCYKEKDTLLHINYPNINGSTTIYPPYYTYTIDTNTTSSGTYTIGTNTTSNCYNINTTSNCCNVDTSRHNSIETGRIEKGSESKQIFNYVDFNPNYTPYHTVEYILKPTSVKGINVSDIRVFCHECGSRIRKKTYKYCPNCGEKL